MRTNLASKLQLTDGLLTDQLTKKTQKPALSTSVFRAFSSINKQFPKQKKLSLALPLRAFI